MGTERRDRAGRDERQIRAFRQRERTDGADHPANDASLSVRTVVPLGTARDRHREQFPKMLFGSRACVISTKANDRNLVERHPPFARFVLRLNQVQLVATRQTSSGEVHCRGGFRRCGFHRSAFLSRNTAQREDPSKSLSLVVGHARDLVLVGWMTSTSST